MISIYPQNPRTNLSVEDQPWELPQVWFYRLDRVLVWNQASQKLCRVRRNQGKMSNLSVIILRCFLRREMPLQLPCLSWIWLHCRESQRAVAFLFEVEDNFKIVGCIAKLNTYNCCFYKGLGMGVGFFQWHDICMHEKEDTITLLIRKVTLKGEKLKESMSVVMSLKI